MNKKRIKRHIVSDYFSIFAPEIPIKTTHFYQLYE